jgi:cytosine/adenosine deaminase-related metal-dependent hydrolase
MTNGHSVSKEAPATLSVRQVLQFATLAGAEASGLTNKVGSLTHGKQADVILIRTSDLNLAPVSDAIGAIVLAAHAGNVDTVIVAGKIVKSGGKMVNYDRERVRSLAQKSLQYILAD